MVVPGCSNTHNFAPACSTTLMVDPLSCIKINIKQVFSFHPSTTVGHHLYTLLSTVDVIQDSKYLTRFLLILFLQFN